MKTKYEMPSQTLKLARCYLEFASELARHRLRVNKDKTVREYYLGFINGLVEAQGCLDDIKTMEIIEPPSYLASKAYRQQCSERTKTKRRRKIT